MAYMCFKFAPMFLLLSIFIVAGVHQTFAEHSYSSTDVESIKLKRFSLQYELSDTNALTFDSGSKDIEYYGAIAKITEKFCGNKLTSYFNGMDDIVFHDFQVQSFYSSTRAPNVIDFDTTASFFKVSSLARNAPSLSIPNPEYIENTVVTMFEDTDSLEEYIEFLLYNIDSNSPFATINSVKIVEKLATMNGEDSEDGTQNYVQIVKLPSFSLEYEFLPSKDTSLIDNEEHRGHVVTVTESFIRSKLTLYYGDILDVNFYDFSISSFSADDAAINIIIFDDVIAKFYIFSTTSDEPLSLRKPTTIDVANTVVKFLTDKDSIREYREYLSYNLVRDNPFISTIGIDFVSMDAVVDNDTSIKNLVGKDEEGNNDNSNITSTIFIFGNIEESSGNEGNTFNSNVILSLLVASLIVLSISLAIQLVARLRRNQQTQHVVTHDIGDDDNEEDVMDESKDHASSVGEEGADTLSLVFGKILGVEEDEIPYFA